MFRRWHEQRLGRHQTTASAGAGATRVVAPPHRAGDTVRRETANAYLEAAGVPVRERGGRPRMWPPTRPPRRWRCPPTSDRQTGNFMGGVHRLWRAKTGHPGGGVHRPRGGAAPGTGPERERMRAVPRDHRGGLARGRNAVAIWQDLVDDHGFQARYGSVRRFVLSLRGRTPIEARVVSRPRPAKKARSFLRSERTRRTHRRTHRPVSCSRDRRPAVATACPFERDACAMT